MVRDEFDLRYVLALAAIVLGAIGIRLIFSSSLSGNDDISVATCALKMVDGDWQDLAGHYCARFGLTVPLAIVFSLAGTGAAQLSVVPAIASLAAILLAWRLGTLLLGPATGLAAAAAAALFPMDIEFAGLAFPDVLQGSLLAACVLCLVTAARHNGTRGWVLAVAGGLFWAWAHFVKIDAFVLGGALLGAALLRVVRWPHVVVAGATALACVGLEIAAYAILTSDPLQRVHWESAASNEVLAAGHDYRNMLVYPKVMFLVPYEAGLHYYAFLLAVAVAVWTRSRPALVLVIWCLLWQAWLTFGADPLSGFRLKPQIGRYLLSWSVPMEVLVGWSFVLAFRRWRPAAIGMAAGAVACAAVFAPFNQLSYEAPQATRIAFDAAREHGWFPLYPDLQSQGIAQFLFHGRPEAALIHPVQHHDFLRGETHFDAIPEPHAYMLVNNDFMRRLEGRSLVRPLDPTRFDHEAISVFEVDNPMPSVSYDSMRLLVFASRLLPGAMRAGIEATAAEVLRPDDARVWRLDAPAPAEEHE